MKSNRYTLDRFEGDYAIFLKRPDEVSQLLIHRIDLGVQLQQGDIVAIEDEGSRFKITKLGTETNAAQQRIGGLLEKLQKKNK